MANTGTLVWMFVIPRRFSEIDFECDMPLREIDCESCGPSRAIATSGCRANRC